MPSTAPSGDTRLILRNLAAIGGLGVLISFWVLACTDWFPVVGGLLGLGGVFAWLAFISGLLTDDRKKQLQLEIERAVLLRRGLWKGVAVTAVVFGGTVSLFGTIELRSLRAEELRVLQIRANADSSSTLDQRDAWILPPFGKTRKVVFTGWGGRELRVRIEGLAAHTFKIDPIVPTRISVPGSFARTIALFRADASITEDLKLPDRRYFFVVTLDGVVLGLLTEPFRGNTVWAGCHADVKLPDAMTEQWRREVPNPPLVWLSSLSVAEETSLDDAREIKGWLLRDIKGLKLGDKVSSTHFQPNNVVYSGARTIGAGQHGILEVLLTP